MDEVYTVADGDEDQLLRGQTGMDAVCVVPDEDGMIFHCHALCLMCTDYICL